MPETWWRNRGSPWDYDPGPPRNRRWATLFAETPNYRGLGKAVFGREKFRWHFGPMFYRGRLRDGQVKVLLIGQEGAQDESLSHRSFTGGTGARMQNFLNYIGITHSYLFLNTFVYPIYGQYGSGFRWIGQDPDSPIVQHRHEILDYVLERNDLRLVVAVGRAAKDTVRTWVRSHGGACTGSDVSNCDGSVLGPRVELVGVVHPGAAGMGGSLNSIRRNFRRATNRIKGWAAADPSWLPPDPGAGPQFSGAFQYRSAPIPFADFPFGTAWRLGRGATSSNRKDRQRSIQLFSAGGRYNNRGDNPRYSRTASGTREGYSDPPGDVPYEPPRDRQLDFDPGPGSRFARLFMGREPGAEWPDFWDMGIRAHASLGWGPIYRGRPADASVIVLADQRSQDDLFTARALTGSAGQHLQAFLRAMGLTERYVILRVLPVDTIGLSSSVVRSIVNDSRVRAAYSRIVDEVIVASSSASLLLAVGPRAADLLPHVNGQNLANLSMRAYRRSGWLNSWRGALGQIASLSYAKDIAAPSFDYNGERGQIPRRDLPYGSLRWNGSSGDRAVRATEGGRPSRDYYKFFMPRWAFRLRPEPLSASERQAVNNMP